MTELVVINNKIFTCDDNWDVTLKNASQLLCVIQRTFDIANCSYTQIDNIAKNILETTFANQPSCSKSFSSPQELACYTVSENSKSGLIINILKLGTRIPHMCIFSTTAKAKTGFPIVTCFLFGLKYIAESSLMRFKTEPLNTHFFVSVLMCLKNC